MYSYFKNWRCNLSEIVALADSLVASRWILGTRNNLQETVALCSQHYWTPNCTAWSLYSPQSSSKSSTSSPGPVKRSVMRLMSVAPFFFGSWSLSSGTEGFIPSSSWAVGFGLGDSLGSFLVFVWPSLSSSRLVIVSCSISFQLAGLLWLFIDWNRFRMLFVSFF